MGSKDLTEKILEDYDDVFADIINVLLFDGENIVNPDELESCAVHSQYKADTGKLHEQERDVAKLWLQGKVKLALYGIENQTRVDKLMPLRVLSYDGASYKSQMQKSESDIVPVVTIVLYFGENRWTAPRTLKGILDIPQGLDRFVNDYQIHVFEIAWLADEQIKKFQSDFGVVARFFSEKRKNPNYMCEDPTLITHVDAVLKLLATMSGDSRFEEVLKTDGKEEIGSMCEVVDRIMNKGIDQGIEQGIAQGIEQGITQVILNMSTQGFSIEQISKSTGKSIEEINNILDANLKSQDV